MGNKLELTWYGKDEPLKIEPRLLIENVKLSYGCEICLFMEIICWH